MSYKESGLKIKKTYNFDIKEYGNSYETIIKVNFPKINGFNRQRLFMKSKNPKFKSFFGNYTSFKNNATTFEALSFFIEILFKHSGVIFVKSDFFDKKFILTSKYKKNTKKYLVKIIIISNFIKKEVIYFKENVTEDKIFDEIKKLKKFE